MTISSQQSAIAILVKSVPAAARMEAVDLADDCDSRVQLRERSHSQSGTRADNLKPGVWLLTQDRWKDVSSKPRNCVDIREVTQVAREKNRVRFAVFACIRKLVNVDTAGIDAQIRKVANRGAINLRHHRRVIPGPADFALVPGEAIRLKPRREFER